MTKFNVGDKVRIVSVGSRCMHGFKVGDICEVTYDDKGDSYRYAISNSVNSGYANAENITPCGGRKDRFTEAEAKIATLESKVAALETVLADKSKLMYSVGGTTFVTNEIVTKTPNQRRADVIKRAQAFVAKHMEYNGKASAGRGVKIGYVVCIPEFIVNKEKRVVTVLFKLVGNRATVHAKAVAKCAPDDVFNADIGKAIALGRALGVKVPKEFTDAVKPTEVVVGMVVKGVRGKTVKVTRMTYSPENEPAFRCEGRPSNHYALIEDVAIILDDTEAVYE